MMKTSFYNFIIKNDKYNNFLIYNSFKNSMLEVEPNVVEYLNSNTFESYEKFDIDIEGYKTLVDYGIITEMDENEERKMVIEFDHTRRQSRLNHADEGLSFTIMPTNSCNFRCYYCYESLSKIDSPGMSELTINKFLKMVTKLLSSGEYKQLEIGWYGGEPLLKLSTIIKIQKALIELCNLHKVKLKSSLVTNGLLLTKETISLLLEHEINSAQVTLDGSEKIHNKRRRFPEDPDKNYETIMSNLANCPDNFFIHIRINLDKFNLGEQYELAKDMENRNIWPVKNNIKLYLAHVRDRDDPFKESLITMDKFRIEDLEFRLWSANEFNRIIPGGKAKFKFTYPSLSQNIGCGFGLSNNSVVIDENGDFFKCWEAVGIDNLKLGCIDDVLNEKPLSEIGKDWVISDSHKTNWGCETCQFLPICTYKCPFEFLHKGEDNYILCSEWKFSIENYLLFQYNIAKENPQIIKGLEV